MIGSHHESGNAKAGQPFDRPCEVADGGVHHLPGKKRVPALAHRINLNTSYDDQRRTGDAFLQLSRRVAEHFVQFQIDHFRNPPFPEFSTVMQITDH
jgi:hypothetical protein